MDNEIKQALEQMSEKIDKVYDSAEKTRKYFLWTLIISVLVVVLPLLGFVLVIPSLFSMVPDLSGL
jgi:polyferredoxin